MDRKTQSFVKTVADLSRENDDFKSSQFSGYDNLALVSLSSSSTYDYTFTFTAGQRYRAFARFSYAGLLKPWQPTTYSRFYPQFFVDSMSSPYEGQANDPVNIIQPRTFSSPDDDLFVAEIVNDDSVTHTVYIKYYIVSTATTGTVSIGGNLL